MTLCPFTIVTARSSPYLDVSRKVPRHFEYDKLVFALPRLAAYRAAADCQFARLHREILAKLMFAYGDAPLSTTFISFCPRSKYIFEWHCANLFIKMPLQCKFAKLIKNTVCRRHCGTSWRSARRRMLPKKLREKLSVFTLNLHLTSSAIGLRYYALSIHGSRSKTTPVKYPWLTASSCFYPYHRPLELIAHTRCAVSLYAYVSKNVLEAEKGGTKKYRSYLPDIMQQLVQLQKKGI